MASQTRFTLTISEVSLECIERAAKDLKRSSAFIVREAIEAWLKQNPQYQEQGSLLDRLPPEQNAPRRKKKRTKK